MQLFYFYSSTYYFKFALWVNSYPCSTVPYNSDILFKPLIAYPGTRRIFPLFEQLSRLFTSPFLLKLKFKGKGYYVFKNKRNTVAPQFGFAHRLYLYAYSITVKLLSKTKLFLYGLSKKDLIKIGHNFKSFRPINIFTGRGVRFTKQILYKKTGKVSAYR
jgi:hypothetical protein